MDDITFVRSHWWLVSEGFSLSTANSDVQKLPATLYHRISDIPSLLNADSRRYDGKENVHQGPTESC